MKKLLASLFLLIPSYCYSDTLTTSEPHLILISTGSIDRTRSWGDKVNYNFSVISASLTTAIAGSGYQSSFAGSKATGAVEMGGFSVNNSSGFTLGTNGKITFPDGTTQNTASVGGSFNEASTHALTGNYTFNAASTVVNNYLYFSTAIGNTIYASSGTTGSPSYSFFGSSITGWYYSPVANEIIFTKSVGGSHGKPLDTFSIQSTGLDIIDNSGAGVAGLGTPKLTIEGNATIANPHLSMGNSGRVFSNNINDFGFSHSASTIGLANSDSWVFQTSMTIYGTFTTTNNVIAKSYFGDGSNLTGISASGGSGSSTTTASYRIVIGTCATWGANVIGNTQNVFTAAISSAGNTGGVFVQRGSYTFVSAVNSVGKSSDSFLNFIFEDGAIMSNNESINMWKLENTKLTNPTFNIQSFGGAANVIEMKNNSTVDGAKFPNLRLRSNNAIFSIVDTSFCYITNCNIPDGDKGGTAYGGISIDGSSDVYISNNYFNFQQTFDQALNGILVQGGKNIFMDRNFVRTHGGAAILCDISAGKRLENFVVRNNTFDLDLAVTGINGALWFANGSGADAGASTGAVTVDSNLFKIRSGNSATGRQAVALYSAGNSMDQCVIKNNTFLSTSPITALAIQVQSVQVTSSIITQNNVTGLSAFLVDSGVGTRYLNLNNIHNSRIIGHIEDNTRGLFIDSATFYGSVTSTTGFYGPGSGLTGITASAIQTLPLIAGDTGYVAIYTTTTWSANQTFTSVSASTFTGKRELRYLLLADAASITPNIASYEWNYQTNTQAVGTLTINAPTGIPSPFQSLGIMIKSTNIQTFAWNGTYRDATGVALPTTTTGGGNTNYYSFLWNSIDSKWDYTGSH